MKQSAERTQGEVPEDRGIQKQILALTRCITFVLMLVTIGCGNSSIEQRLNNEIAKWEGAPYCWAGTSRNGVDCSGFVMVIYHDIFGMSIPRTTRDQMRIGTPIAEIRMLEAGDLVFFITPKNTRHVGIYLGDFCHASSTHGVTRSSIYNKYWKKAFQTARRVL